jgi:hypothetical protein
MPPLNTLEQFATKFEQLGIGQLKGGQDWRYDWLALLAVYILAAPIQSTTSIRRRRGCSHLLSLSKSRCLSQAGFEIWILAQI